MKKIFTLVCLALVTISANAQREIWDPNTEEIQALITTTKANPTKISNDNFVSVSAATKVFEVDTRDACQASGDWSSIISIGTKIELTSWIMETGTTSVKLKVVSTPDSGDAADSPDNGLQMAGNDGGQALKGVEGFPTFTKYLKGKNGSGGTAYLEFYELNSEGNQTFRVVETPWVKGCGVAPAKGFYCQFTPSKDGYITAGIWLNKNLNSKTLFVIDGADYSVVPVKIQGFRNNNTWEYQGDLEEKPATCVEWTLDENNMLIFDDSKKSPTDTNQQFFAYVTWQVKKDGNYYLTGGNSCIGISGFFFDETDPAGITAVTESEKVDGPVYNLAGQRVDKNYKGVVIQNGKKFMNK